jgi:hypothetical protein
MNTASGPVKKATPVNCPRCTGLFRLPPGISVKTVIVCPHCQSDLGVDDLLNEIPVAEISKDSPVLSEKHAEDTAKTPVIEPSKYAIDEGEFTIPKPLKTARRSGRSHHPPRKRTTTKVPFARPKQGKIEWLKIALGGLLALPIAQIILWWVFAVDPLNLSHRVHAWVPVLVPPALSPNPQIEDNDRDWNRDMPPGQILRDDGIPFPVVK